MDAIEVEDGDVRWRFDRSFLESHWTCLWGRGCVGIGPEPAPQAGLGCCSLGADLDADEAPTVVALAATLGPEVFQHRASADHGGVLAPGGRSATRVVDGACIFLNRPGFPGGAGCALHLAAVEAGESPIDWKPSVCWQLPLRVEWAPDAARGGEAEVATVRRWSREDWGAVGATMAWCCTEGDDAYVGDRRVIDSLGDELAAVAGTAVYVELRRRLDADST